LTSLILAVLASFFVGIALKVSENAGRPRLPVALINYCVAFLGALAVWAANGALGFPLPVLLTGVFAGVTWVVSLIAIMYAVKLIGVAVSSAVNRVAIIVPIILSLSLWGEEPTTLIVCGIAMAILAVVVMSWGSAMAPNGVGRANTLAIIGLLCASGLAQLASKLFAQYCEPDFKASWSVVLFASAIVTTLAWMLIVRVKPSRADIRYGVFVGVPNLLSALFLVAALTQLPAVVVFPTTSAGGMVLLALAGAVIFREKLSRATVLGIAMAVLAVVLVNMRY
jgi:drug/metabolite transporter (DMT)-like permease